MDRRKNKGDGGKADGNREGGEKNNGTTGEDREFGKRAERKEGRRRQGNEGHGTKIEKKGKERKKNNVIINRVGVEGTVKQTVEKLMEIMEALGAKGAMERITERGRGRRNWRETTIEVRVDVMAGTGEVMRQKTK